MHVGTFTCTRVGSPRKSSILPSAYFYRSFDFLASPACINTDGSHSNSFFIYHHVSVFCPTACCASASIFLEYRPPATLSRSASRQTKWPREIHLSQRSEGTRPQSFLRGPPWQYARDRSYSVYPNRTIFGPAPCFFFLFPANPDNLSTTFRLGMHVRIIPISGVVLRVFMSPLRTKVAYARSFRPGPLVFPPGSLWSLMVR